MTVVIPSIGIPSYLIYMVFHIKLQILMLTDYVQKLKIKFSKIDDEKLRSDFAYQSYVLSQMKYIVDRHLAIKK